jgi:hypothetical protein
VTLDVVSRHPSYAYEKLLISVDFWLPGQEIYEKDYFLYSKIYAFLQKLIFRITCAAIGCGSSIR